VRIRQEIRDSWREDDAGESGEKIGGAMMRACAPPNVPASARSEEGGFDVELERLDQGVRTMRAMNMASLSASWGQIRRVPSVAAPVRGWGKGSSWKSV
jgi:hypothetical protein